MIDQWMRGLPGKIVYFIICLGFLAFGLIRLGVSSTALAQIAGWVEFAEISEAIADVERFMAEHADQSLYAFGVVDYFGYIAAMGIVLVAGSIGALRYKAIGLKLIGAYLLMHGALFANAMVINPKVFLLGFTVILLGMLAWIRPKIGKE